MEKPFDIHRYVETLRSADVPEGHALASAQALTVALAEAAQASLLTKDELMSIKSETDSIKLEVRLLRWVPQSVVCGT